jgi:hypothetical protein
MLLTLRLMWKITTWQRANFSNRLARDQAAPSPQRPDS